MKCGLKTKTIDVEQLKVEIQLSSMCGSSQAESKTMNTFNMAEGWGAK